MIGEYLNSPNMPSKIINHLKERGSQRRLKLNREKSGLFF